MHWPSIIFSGQVMAANTAGSLDTENMRHLEDIILAKYGRKKSTTDKESLWSTCQCRTAIGQRCKNIRLALRKGHKQ